MCAKVIDDFLQLGYYNRVDIVKRHKTKFVLPQPVDRCERVFKRQHDGRSSGRSVNSVFTFSLIRDRLREATTVGVSRM